MNETRTVGGSYRNNPTQHDTRSHEGQASPYSGRKAQTYESKYGRTKNREADYVSSVKHTTADPNTSGHYVYERTTVIAGDVSSPIKTTTIIESRGPTNSQLAGREDREVGTTYTRQTPNNHEGSTIQRSYGGDKSGSKDRIYTPTRGHLRQGQGSAIAIRGDAIVDNSESAYAGVTSSSRDRRERYLLNSPSGRYAGPDQHEHIERDRSKQGLATTNGTSKPASEQTYSAVKERSPGAPPNIHRR